VPDLHTRRNLFIGKESDGDRHRRPLLDPPESRCSDRGLHRGMPAHLDLDTEERMTAGTEDRAGSVQGGRRVVGFADHSRPVQLRRREVGKGDEEPINLDDLAALDDVGANAFTLEARGSDPIGEVHPGMLPATLPGCCRSAR